MERRQQRLGSRKELRDVAVDGAGREELRVVVVDGARKEGGLGCEY